MLLTCSISTACYPGALVCTLAVSTTLSLLPMMLLIFFAMLSACNSASARSAVLLAILSALAVHLLPSAVIFLCPFFFLEDSLLVCTRLGHDEPPGSPDGFKNYYNTQSNRAELLQYTVLPGNRLTHEHRKRNNMRVVGIS